jgi:hypothetical protein
MSKFTFGIPHIKAGITTTTSDKWNITTTSYTDNISTTNTTSVPFSSNAPYLIDYKYNEEYFKPNLLFQLLRLIEHRSGIYHSKEWQHGDFTLKKNVFADIINISYCVSVKWPIPEDVAKIIFSRFIEIQDKENSDIYISEIFDTIYDKIAGVINITFYFYKVFDSFKHDENENI